jgi:dTDP-4-dehydrorhamnose 3,5-epimerase
MPFQFERLDIPDMILIETQIFEDHRGFFMETYKRSEFEAGGVPWTFVQDSFSHSIKGVLRGLHYQIQQTQGKLVRVVRGEVYDVAVDLRRSSKYFGRWLGIHLSAENRKQLWIPGGFAHGFYVLSEWAEVMYKATDFYAPQWERTLRWNDPDIGIDWPLIGGNPPILSTNDTQGAMLRDCDLFD